MKKRAAATVLWLYATWCAGAMIAHILGVSGALGPILGIAAATIVASDPRSLIWNRTAAPRTSPISASIQTPV